MSCLLLLARLQEETEAAVEALQPFCVYVGFGIKCGLCYCVAWKMSLHGGVCLSSYRFKENPDSGHTTGNTQRLGKGQNMRPIQGDCIVTMVYASLIVLNCFRPSSIQMWWSPQWQFEIKRSCLCWITSDLWCLSNRSLSAIEPDLCCVSPGQIVSLLDESVFVSLPVSLIFPQSDESH